jgi:hypothetical protein
LRFLARRLEILFKDTAIKILGTGARHAKPWFIVLFGFVEMQTCHHGNTIELRIISQNGKIIGTVSQKD